MIEQVDRFYSEGDRFYDDLIADINSAEISVYIEIYIFSGDETGERLLKALIRAAQRNIDVILIYDRVGSLFTPEHFFNRLISAGGRAYPFRPFFKRLFADREKQRSYFFMRFITRLLRIVLTELYRRNHRKIFIIDNKTAYIGGFNVMNECSLQAYGPERWNDFMLKTEKSAVIRELYRLFSDSYRKVKKSEADFGPVYRKRARETVIYPAGPPFGVKSEQTLTYGISKAMKKLLRTAEKRIYLMYPYFIPYGTALRTIRKKAAHEKLDVRIYLSERSDQKLVNLLSLSIARRLLKNGVKVYIYRGRNENLRFNHGKLCLVDDWCGLGSVNFDSRSFILNYEVLLFSSDPRLYQEAQKRLAEIEAESYAADKNDLPGVIWFYIFYPLRRFL